MNVMIAGGAGFLGRALTRALQTNDHRVWVLTRKQKRSFPAGAQAVYWDGRTADGWGHIVNDMDVVIHLAGKSLASWPWTKVTKRAFVESRLQPGLALTAAFEQAEHRPRVFIQASGINRYGLRGNLADESTPPAGDFLAQLTIEWEDSTKKIEELGVRRVITRSAVVLAKAGGMLPLMALPLKLFAGGPLGSGRQVVPWIHLADWLGAVRFLIQNESARGPFNLIAPAPASNADFNRALARVLHRPYWLPMPAFLLRIFLGEMSVLILEGRPAQPKRLVELGYRFRFERPAEALADLYR